MSWQQQSRALLAVTVLADADKLPKPAPKLHEVANLGIDSSELRLRRDGDLFRRLGLGRT
jgi:hypothetical protein